METIRQDSASLRVDLPEPVRERGPGLNGVLQARRSVRHYQQNGQVALHEISQLLWAAQGLSSHDGYRTSPSAGALYPLEIRLVARDVHGIAPGVYCYEVASHSLICSIPVDTHEDLTRAAHHQDCVRQSAAVLSLTAVPQRTAVKYGRRGTRYIHMEAGHAAQNILLTATSLDLAAVPVGAFEDSAVARVLKLPGNEKPLYLIPIGRPGR